MVKHNVADAKTESDPIVMTRCVAFDGVDTSISCLHIDATQGFASLCEPAFSLQMKTPIRGYGHAYLTIKLNIENKTNTSG